MVDERNACVKDVRCDMVCFEATEKCPRAPPPSFVPLFLHLHLDSPQILCRRPRSTRPTPWSRQSSPF